MTIKVDIIGLSQLHAILNALPKELERKVLVTALRAGGRVIVKSARQKAPFRTGILRKSIVVRKAKKSRGGKGIIVEVGTTSIAFYSHIVEFGSRYTSPRPFLRPAFDETKTEVIKAVGKAIARGLKRVAKK